MGERTYTKLFDEVRLGVAELLGDDDSGHGMDHIDRVDALGTRFSVTEGLTSVEAKIARLAGMLHDVDDYKLVGREKSLKLENATKIMTAAGIGDGLQVPVRGIIRTMGYNKALKGIRPNTLPGMVVSDADMCDAIGAVGVIRCLEYAVSSKGSGVVFDPTVWPLTDLTVEQYNSGGSTHSADSFINHFFEKLLKLKGMMQTQSGQQEATVRDEVMVLFLRQYLIEQNQPNWVEYLNTYVEQR